MGSCGWLSTGGIFVDQKLVLFCFENHGGCRVGFKFDLGGEPGKINA